MANRWFAGWLQAETFSFVQLCGVGHRGRSPPNGAARPKLVPIPILSYPRSNTSGLFIKILTKRLDFCFLGKVSVFFQQAGVFRACGRDQGAFEESPLDPKPF